MEQQTLSQKETTLLEVLGANEPGKENIGIIREQQAWMHRRAVDYLVVGLVTDLDDTDEGRDQRFEAYVDTINADLEVYRQDVKLWDLNHLRNKIESLEEKQYDYDLKMEVRRYDLPSREVCKRSFVGRSAQDTPERDILTQVAHETIAECYDEALTSAKAILNDKLKDILGALPVAPIEEIEEGVKTQDVLQGELEIITSKLEIIERLSSERQSMSGDDAPDIKQDEKEEDLDVYERRQPAHVLAKVGGKVLHLVGAR